MAQPNKYTPQTSFAGDVRANKPGRDLINAGALDRELRYIRVTANGLCDNLALLQRDDGKLKDAVVGVHTLHKDVLMLLGKYELFGLWEANRPYLQGYVVEHEGKLYVCAESHDANDAMDLSKFKAFGAAGGGALTGDYLPVNWAESFFADDADGLTAAGVYVLADNDEASFLVVLGNGENVGQLRITPAGLRVRFQTASGWGEWVDAGAKMLPDTLDENSGNVIADDKHTHKLARASNESAGIVKLGHNYESGDLDVAASLKALSDGLNNAKEFASSEIVKAIVNVGGGTGGGTGGGMMVSDVPVGCLMYFDLEEAPAGYLVADGSEKPQKDYPELYAAIGERYGKAADGHFKLPDRRAEFLRGLDMGRGIDIGRELGSSQVSTVGRHYHGTSVTSKANGLNMGFPVGFWDDGTGTEPAPPGKVEQFPWRQNGNNRLNFAAWEKQQARTPTAFVGAGAGSASSPFLSLKTGKYFGGTISSLDIPADGGTGESYPRNGAALLCIKAIGGSGMIATDERPGLVKLYQTVSGHESAIDGALSVRGAKALADESSKWQNLTGVPDSFKPSEHRHGWAEIDDKPSEFIPAAHKHKWADITGAPEWVLKSDYEAKIEALEARLAALENPAGG